MSRIGNSPISVMDDVNVKIEGKNLEVSGKKATQSIKIHNKNIESITRHLPPQYLFFLQYIAHEKTNSNANKFLGTSKLGKKNSSPSRNKNRISNIANLLIYKKI